MNLYIDCEFDGWQGQLLSIALVSRNELPFYVEIEFDKINNPWVEKNVVPHLNHRKVSYREASNKLQRYLQQFPVDTPICICADYPDDLKYFMELTIIGPGETIFLPETLNFRLDFALSSRESQLPHHAYFDAKAIMDSDR